MVALANITWHLISLHSTNCLSSLHFVLVFSWWPHFNQSSSSKGLVYSLNLNRLLFEEHNFFLKFLLLNSNSTIWAFHTLLQTKEIGSYHEEFSEDEGNGTSVWNFIVSRSLFQSLPHLNDSHCHTEKS